MLPHGTPRQERLHRRPETMRKPCKTLRLTKLAADTLLREALFREGGAACLARAVLMLSGMGAFAKNGAESENRSKLRARADRRAERLPATAARPPRTW